MNAPMEIQIIPSVEILLMLDYALTFNRRANIVIGIRMIKLAILPTLLKLVLN